MRIDASAMREKTVRRAVVFPRRGGAVSLNDFRAFF
jgi:hypothetical protein